MILIKSAIVCVPLTFLSGCTAILWHENDVVTEREVAKPQMEDVISDVSHSNNQELFSMLDKSKVDFDMPPESIVLLGGKNFYILAQGGNDFLLLDSHVIKENINSEQKIKFWNHCNCNNTPYFFFYGSVHFEANKDGSLQSLNEQQAIDSKEYPKSVELAGVIIPKSSIKYSSHQTSPLTKKYYMELYSGKKEHKIEPGNLARNIIFTPLTLAADIVFFPISLYTLYDMSTGHHNFWY